MPAPTRRAAPSAPHPRGRGPRSSAAAVRPAAAPRGGPLAAGLGPGLWALLLAAACAGPDAQDAQEPAAAPAPRRKAVEPIDAPGMVVDPETGRLVPLGTQELAAPPAVPSEPVEEPEQTRNFVSLLLGATQTGEGSQATLGLSYARWVWEDVGFGPVLEVADRDAGTEYVFVLAAFVRPTEHFQIKVGPGLEYVSGANEVMVRTAFEYFFPLGGGFALAPSLAVDVVSGRNNKVVFGVALGYGF